MAKKWSEIKHKSSPEQREAVRAEAEAFVQKMRAHELRKELRIAKKVLEGTPHTKSKPTSREPGTGVNDSAETVPSQSRAA